MPRLRDIQVDELSLVHRGANRRPFSVTKSDDDPGDLELVVEKTDGEDTLVKELADGDADEGRAALAAFRLLKALPATAVASIRKAAGMDAAMTDTGADEDEDEPDEDDYIAKSADELDEQPVEKAKYTADQRRQMAKDGEALPDGSYPIADKEDLENAIHAVGRGKNNSHADIRAHIVKRAKALGATDLLPADWNVSKEDANMTDTATVPVKKEDGTWDLSGVPEEQRPGMEAFLKSIEAERDAELDAIRKAADDEKSELEKKADDALAIAKAERDARETREFVAKAEELGQGEEFGPVLKAVAAAVDTDTFEKLEAVLKANHERAKAAGLYEEIGKSGHSNGSTDAKTQLDAKADEIRKADPSLTGEQALVKAYESNPELYAQLRNEES